MANWQAVWVPAKYLAPGEVCPLSGRTATAEQRFVVPDVPPSLPGAWRMDWSSFPDLRNGSPTYGRLMADVICITVDADRVKLADLKASIPEARVPREVRFMREAAMACKQAARDARQAAAEAHQPQAPAVRAAVAAEMERLLAAEAAGGAAHSPEGRAMLARVTNHLSLRGLPLARVVAIAQRHGLDLEHDAEGPTPPVAAGGTR